MARTNNDTWDLASISLDYRLAPEHPFPADVEDVVAAQRVRG